MKEALANSAGRKRIDRWCNPKQIFYSTRTLFVQQPWHWRHERAVATGAFAYRYDAVSRSHISPGTPNCLLISLPTVLPHVTLQITSLIALNLARLWLPYTQRRLIGTIHYMRAGLFQATGHSWWWMWWTLKERLRGTFRVGEHITYSIHNVIVLHENAVMHNLKAM